MASFIGRSICRNLLKNVKPTNNVKIVSISTTKKDKESSTATPQLFEDGLPEKFDPRVTSKTWVHWGFDRLDREQDATFVHLIFFGFITLIFVCGGTYVAYAPRGLREWAQREAYLEIRRREAAGLPHIDPWIIDPEKVILPTDEELGDREIVI